MWTPQRTASNPSSADYGSAAVTANPDPSIAPSRRMVAVSDITGRYNPSRIYFYNTMFRLIAICKAQWPDFHHWQHVKFVPEAVATMLIGFMDYVESQIELVTDFFEFVYCNDTSSVSWEGDVFQIGGRESAEVVINMADVFLDRLPVLAYGISPNDDDGESIVWLMAVLCHVTDVNRDYLRVIIPETYAGIEETIPLATINPSRSYLKLGRLVTDILREWNHHDLADCLLYCQQDTDNEYANYSFDQVIQFEEWAIDLTEPGELERHHNLQEEADQMSDTYRSITDLLDGDIDGTMAFIAPLYDAIDEAHRRRDALEATGILANLPDDEEDLDD